MARNSEFFFAAVFLIASAGAQAQTAPNVSQVLVYSATNPTTGAAAAIFTQTTADASHTVQSDYTVTNDFADVYKRQVLLPKSTATQRWRFRIIHFQGLEA